MNKTRRSATGKIGFVLCTALLAVLTGCTTYVDQPRTGGGYSEEQPREVYVPQPPVYVTPPAVQVEAPVGSVGVVIRSENDFYEPLSEYGRWEVVGPHGRCWIPGRVDRDWRPYCNGNWERTDAGWYWASDEPWAWATYHYGRWDLSSQLGWYWVPQTQWAPAWVSWHEGGGYVGWAPLQPSARVSGGGSVALNVALIAPRAFVFVEPRRFLEPVRPATVVVNNTTIINKTVNITNIKVVNNTVINEGPRTQIIEQASGQKLKAVPVRELRRKQEAQVVARQGIPTSASEKRGQTPVRSEVEPRETKTQLDAQRRAKESAAAAQAQSQRSAKELENKTQLEAEKRRASEAAATAQAAAQRNAKELENKARLEAQQRRANEAAANAQAAAQRSARGLEKKTQLEAQQRANLAAAKAREETQRNARVLDKNAQRVSEQPAKNKADPRVEKGATKLLKNDRKKVARDPQTPPEKPVIVPPPSSP